jgi:N-glycosylase/DNA lyase
VSGIATWSEWRALKPGQSLGAGVLAEVLDGGQAFRWTGASDGAWFGLWSSHAVKVRLDGRSNLEWSAPAALAPAAESALGHYFDVDRDAAMLADRLPWRSDAHLARCIEAFPGLRILRQPFGEALLCFLCSAAKQIVQIKQMAAQLAERHGAPLLDDALLPEALRRLRRLPTWPQLAAATEPALRECRLGFRARHIHRTARFLAEHPDWLEETERLPYADAKLRLCSLPGVGEKIADCVLLFGAGRLEAFPVDVWVIRAISRRYGLAGWKPSQIAQFGRAHFGPLAGLAQQYLFAWERKNRQLDPC